MKKNHVNLNVDHLRARLKLKSIQSASLLKAHHPQALNQLESTGLRVKSLRTQAARVLASGVTMASIVMPPAQIIHSATSVISPTSEVAPYTPDSANQKLKASFSHLLSVKTSHFDKKTEAEVSSLIKDTYGIKAVPELDGNRLNDSWGFIGAEQHLPRFPGDSISQHDTNQSSGLTPGRGAWGYFVNSKADLTEDVIQKEKYYFAVQTLYLPDWSTRLAYLRDWYKHRKMVAINPVNGKAVVGVVADSGPSWWTGKVFGGSPEIMGYLNMFDGRQKGKIILYFVDDPENKVPLGPLEYNLESPPLLVAS